MFDNVMFFIYIFAAFMGFAGIALIALVLKHKKGQWSETLIATFWFVVCSLLIGVVYFINMYACMLVDCFETGPVLRALDVGGFVALELFWIKLIRATVRSEDPGWNKCDCIWNRIIGMIALWAAVSYAVLPNDYYYVASPAARNYMILIQVVLCLTMTVFILINVSIAVKRVKKRNLLLYITSTSVLILANGLWNGLTTIGLFKGRFFIMTWTEDITDPTSLFIILINILTLIYILKHDFSPLFFADSEEKGDVELLGIIAEEGNLTRREKEVAELVYAGLSNEEIAEKLFISRNTVKHHIYNFYKKLGISTRVDLIYLIKNKK